jgi:hypothetical protein
MFPDFTRLRPNQRLEAKAFAAVPVGDGLEKPELEMNREECEKCGACSKYQVCYDFSLAKLLMNIVLMNVERRNPWVGAYQ